MILMARTTPLCEVGRRFDGLSIFLVGIATAREKGMTVRPILNMVNHKINELFFDHLDIVTDNLIGEEGEGFHYILTGLDAERAPIAAECVGDGYWFVDSVCTYAREGSVLGHPIGQNRGVRFLNAESFNEAEAASLMRFGAGEPSGSAANIGQYLAAKASRKAANARPQFRGGYGFASEYSVERKLRETRLYVVAPI